MTSKLLRTVPLAAALLAAPAVLEAQQVEPTPAPGAAAGLDSAGTAQVQVWLAEIQQLNGRLQQLQQQALQDPELNAAQEALGVRIRTAMESADPTLATGMERVAALQAEAETAREAGNDTRLNEIAGELRQIEGRFVEAQQRALASPEISGDLEAFQARLEARLTELDPEVPNMIARFQELQQMLAAALEGGA